MKIKNLLSAMAILLFAGANLFAVNHGSVIKKNAPIVGENATYAAFWSGANATVDFKAVTVGGKLWATFTGKGSYTLAGNGWSSQVQLYNGETKLNEISNASGEANYITLNVAAKTMTVTAYPLAAAELAFNAFRALQEDNNQFGWTDIITYNVAAPSSGLTGDAEKPALTKAEAGEQAGASLPVSFDATDNSGDYFYIVTDATNGFQTVLFESTGTLIGLKANTDYTFSVVAIDYSGNESDPLTFTNGGAKPFESILAGIARDINFELGSTTTALQIRAKTVTTGTTFTNLSVQIGDENTVFGDTPTPYDIEYLNFAGASSVSYTISNAPLFNTAKDGIIYLNFTYILGPNVDPEGNQQGWDDLYGKTTKAGTLTAGARSGERIAIKLGDGEIKGGVGLKDLNPVKTRIAQTGEAILIQSQETIQSVSLYSINGQLVDANASATISTAKYSKGVYVLKVKDNKGNVDTFKVVVK